VGERHRADDAGMKRIAPLIVAVIVINVLLRVVPLPDVDLSWISVPDLPGWVHTVLRMKNLVLIGIIVTAIAAAIVEDHRKRAR
jgi:hypothetical protein